MSKVNNVRFVSVDREYKSDVTSYNETNDCFVKAVASAYDVPYKDALDYTKVHFNRQSRKGVYNPELIIKKGGMRDLEQLSNRLTFNVTSDLGRKYYKSTGKLRKKTIGSFLKEEHKGTYLIIVRGHAFTIKDGVVFGSDEDAKQLRTRIEFIYKVDSNLRPE